MDKKLLGILCCPATHKGLALADRDTLARVNAAISAKELRNRGGQAPGSPLDEALITDDGKLLYPVVNGIPVLLESESVDMEQLH